MRIMRLRPYDWFKNEQGLGQSPGLALLITNSRTEPDLVPYFIIYHGSSISYIAVSTFETLKILYLACIFSNFYCNFILYNMVELQAHCFEKMIMECVCIYLRINTSLQYTVQEPILHTQNGLEYSVRTLLTLIIKIL